MNSASPGNADAGNADAGNADAGNANAGNADDGGGDAGSADDVGTDAGKADDAGAGQRGDAAAPQQPSGGDATALVPTATDDGGASTEVPEVLPFYETLCPPTLLDDLEYAQGNDFWLGNQSETMLRVDGYGYFASFGGDDATPTYRYAKTLALSVGPDGTLEDHAGYALLGYSAHPVADECLTTLRAPIGLPPKGTSRIELSVNLSSLSNETTEPFDVTSPTRIAIAAPFSVPLIDPDGQTRNLALYVEHYAPGSFRYHIVVASDEIYPGETGLLELNFGDLEFDSVGALYWERSPETCKQFVGASAPLCFTLDFGKSIGDDGTTGPESSTSLPSATNLSKQSSDGYAKGTGTRVEVDANGAVQVLLDNGQVRTVGTLAFARFPKEDALLPLDGTTFRQTEASGAPAFDKPGGPGRGTVLR